jgi:hypothetical protein
MAGSSGRSTWFEIDQDVLDCLSQLDLNEAVGRDSSRLAAEAAGDARRLRKIFAV